MATEVLQKTVTASANGVYGPDTVWFDVRGRTFVTMSVKTLGGTSVDARPVGTADPAALSAAPGVGSPGLESLSYRTTGNNAYASTATTINAGSSDTFHLDPADMMPFIGLQLSGMVGTVNVTATIYAS